LADEATDTAAAGADMEVAVMAGADMVDMAAATVVADRIA
jgi:hypothetical protein